MIFEPMFRGHCVYASADRPGTDPDVSRTGAL